MMQGLCTLGRFEFAVRYILLWDTVAFHGQLRDSESLWCGGDMPRHNFERNFGITYHRKGLR